MTREELNKLSTTELRKMAGVDLDLFRAHGFSREQLIEIILTPND